jgi:S1-C subfamily serine protease
MAVTSPSELQEQVSRRRPGDKANISYIRNGKEVTVPITMRNIAGNTNVVTPGMGGSASVYGARFETLGPADKERFDIDYGVKVSEINEGKFEDLGIRKGYIILSINGRKVKTAAEVRQATDNESQLNAIEGIQSNGTRFSYSFRN